MESVDQEFHTKMAVLIVFVSELRKATDLRCWMLADALEKVVWTGDAEQIEAAFVWAEENYG